MASSRTSGGRRPSRIRCELGSSDDSWRTSSSAPPTSSEHSQLPGAVISYHVRRLEALGFVALDKRTAVRGVVQHHYRLTDRDATIQALEHVDELARLARSAPAPIDWRVRHGLTALGETVGALREASDVSVMSLALRTGLAPGSIEAGKADPRMSVVARVAEALDLTLLDVLRSLEERRARGSNVSAGGREGSHEPPRGA